MIALLGLEFSSSIDNCCTKIERKWQKTSIVDPDPELLARSGIINSGSVNLKFLETKIVGMTSAKHPLVTINLL